MHVDRMLCVALAALAFGCSGGGDDELPPPITQGTVTDDQTGRTGQALTYKAFGFATNGTGVVYATPNPDATCDGVFEYLTASGSYDPVNVLVADHCTLALRFQYTDGEGFDGNTYTGDDLGTFWNVNCAMGAGTWELSGDGRERDYFFEPEVDGEGGWWQGNARTFTSTVTAGADTNTPDVELDLGPDFGGQFIYEDTNQDPATGSISGIIETERCQKLVQTPLFGG